MQGKFDLANSGEFTLVGPKQPSPSKLLLSPLYNTLLELQDKNPLINSLRLRHKQTQKGGVFYIPLVTPKNQLNIPHFQFNECHLTVNQHYKQDVTGVNNGLSTVHYTECYKNHLTEENIILHVYFTKQGFFKYAQAKCYKGTQRENGEELNLTADQMVQIRENITETSQLVSGLLEENFALYTNAVEAANKLDRSLQLMSRTQVTSMKNYLEKARQFIEAVNKINLFSYASKDMRGEWMAALIKSINQNELEFQGDERIEKETHQGKRLEKETIQSAAKPIVSNDGDSPKNNAQAVRKNKILDTTRKALKQYHIVDSLIQSIIEVTSKLEEQPNNIPLLIKSCQLKDELNLQLLFLSTCSSGLNQEQKTHLKEWQSAKYQKTNLLDVFLEYFWKGDLEVVQEFYPLVNHLLSANDIIDLLTKLVDHHPAAEKQKGMKDVFNFLYEKSSFYQMVIQSATLMLGDSQTRLFCSLLTNAFLNNNLFAFEILLEHGTHPNSMGMSYNGWQIPNLTVISTLTLSHDTLPYLRLALQYGGDHNTPSAPINIDKRKTPQRSQNFIMKGRNRNNEEGFLEEFQGMCEKTILEVCRQCKKYKALSLFIPQMSFEELLETAGYLINETYIRQRNLVPAFNHDCVVVSDYKCLMDVQDKTIDFKRNTNLLTILIYGEDQNECLDVIQQLIDRLRPKIHALTKDSPEELIRLQQAALDITRLISPSNKPMAYKFGCCMLLLMLDPNPTFMTYQRLMQLYCREAAYAQKISLLQHDKVKYLMAKCVAEESCFASELMKTPMYKFVLDKLDSIFPGDCEAKSAASLSG